MASRFDLTATARRLLNMEVNTILCDAPTAEPMPQVPHALLDIACQYAGTLVELGVDLKRYFDTETAKRPELSVTWTDPGKWPSDSLKVSSDTFDALRWAATGAENSPEAKQRIKPSQRALLDRIVNNCDAIKGMFKRFRFESSTDTFIDKTRADLLQNPIAPNSYVVAPDDLALLQKIWDIGTDEIVAQTIVYLTGDVTTRVQKPLASQGSGPLFTIHRQSIDVSINCWKGLLDAVGAIAGNAVSVLLGVKK